MSIGRRETAALLANEIEDALVRIDGAARRKSIEAAAKVGAFVSAMVFDMPRDARERLLDHSGIENAVRVFIYELSGTPFTGDTKIGGTDTVGVVSLNGILTPVSEWAGPVAGPTFLEEQCGISRSTLYRWQRRGEAIAFRTGGRKHVFPLLQFVDGRPVPEIDKLLGLIGSPRDTWLWLIQPCEILDNDRPIDLLRKDLVLEVLNAARKVKREQ